MTLVCLPVGSDHNVHAQSKNNSNREEEKSSNLLCRISGTVGSLVLKLYALVSNRQDNHSL